MSAHYSKFGLNTYNGAAYFKAHIPADYPLEEVLQKCRAFYRLPPTLRELCALSKAWCQLQPGDIDEIDAWYDSAGRELNPLTGQRLTDEEIDAQWNDNKALAMFKVTDIPLPPGGFADPNTWEEPIEEVSELDPDFPDEDKIVADIKSHGREYNIRYWGVPDDMAAKAKTDRALARAIRARSGYA